MESIEERAHIETDSIEREGQDIPFSSSLGSDGRREDEMVVSCHIFLNST